MQVHHFLENAAETSPGKAAVWYRDNWSTYEEVENAAGKIAFCLVDSGIRRGERVAIIYENSFDYVAAYFGILKAGGVAVGLNTETTPDALSYLLENSESAAVIVSEKAGPVLREALKTGSRSVNVIAGGKGAQNPFQGAVRTVSLEDVYGGNSLSQSVRTVDLDLAEIVYTSGSTGKPKGVMLSHLNLVSNMRSICKYLRLSEDDRIMVVLPFYYIYGKSLLLTHFLTGGSVVIDNRFVYPNKVLETMRNTSVTGFAGVPSTFMILLNRSGLGTAPIPSLRYVTQAGGAMAPAVQKEVVRAFSPAEVFIMYGATEAAPRLSYLEPELLFSKWGSIGKPVDNVDLIVADPEGNELPRGEVGEIAARGSNIMNGYWKDPEGTAEVLRKDFILRGISAGRMKMVFSMSSAAARISSR